MIKLRIPMLALLLASAATAQDAPPRSKERVAQLQQQYRQLLNDLKRDFKKLTELPEDQREAEGEKIYAKFQLGSQGVGEELVAIAEKEPADEIAAQAIGAALSMDIGQKAVRRLLVILDAHHALSAAIGEFVAMLQWLQGPGVDPLLEKIVAQNPSTTARGRACLVLAQRAEGERNREALLERCIADFADVELQQNADAAAAKAQKVGEVAGRTLFAMRNIKIGKTPPDIAGTDMDGVSFKLSDYKGKVVVLDFWGFW